MRYQQLKPPPALAPYVACYWAGEVDIAPNQVFHYQDIARSKAELLFICEGRFDKPATGKPFEPRLHGPSNSFEHHTSSTGTFGLFGVQFYPHALPELFSIPASEMANEQVDLAVLLGKQVAELADRMGAATSLVQRASVVSSFLEKYLRKSTRSNAGIHFAINQIHHSRGFINLQNLTAQSGFSQRQFERLFKQQAGFSPKSYARIVRFESILETYARTGKPLTELAHEYGYFDQAHFNHDFKGFTGYNPSQFFSLLADPFQING